MKTIHDAISEFLAVHCETRGEAKRILSLAHRTGRRWTKGNMIEVDNWGEYKENTCYCIASCSYGSVDYFTEHNYRIIKSTLIL